MDSAEKEGEQDVKKEVKGEGEGEEGEERVVKKEGGEDEEIKLSSYEASKLRKERKLKNAEELSAKMAKECMYTIALINKCVGRC